MAEQMTSALLNKLYPMVSKSLTNNKAKYKGAISRFMQYRSKELYDTAPCDRMLFGTTDIDDYFKCMGFTPADVGAILSQTYYGDMPLSDFCKAAKDEFTVTQLTVIRYFLMKNDIKEAQLAAIYLAFSGKFYPSIHYKMFPKVQPSEYRYVMDYVVNQVLTNKFDLKRTGSVMGAIRCIVDTWLDAYKNMFKSYTDEDAVYVIQQLHSRMSAFMRNIATEYYRAYENKDKEYMTLDSDNLSADSYRLADNDSLKAERTAESTVEYLNTSGVDYSICTMAADNNVRVTELKGIVEGILTDPDSKAEVREFIRLLIVQYYAASKDKDVRDIKFITTTIAPKPNAKDKNILRAKEIVEGWLSEKSPQYRKRKSRIATRSSYYKSIYTYFAVAIHKANK